MAEASATGSLTPKTSKKRLRNVPQWTRTKKKRLRNSGEAYVTHKKVQVPAKRLDTTPCKCKQACFEKVSQEQREKLFSGFWKTSDFDLQNAYISGCVKVVSVKRRYTENPCDSRRNLSRLYFVQNGGIATKVCKEAFLKIHAITNGRLDRALKAVVKNDGSPHQDQRGRHEPKNKTAEEQVEYVKKHISSFPTYSSHYSRADNPNRRYLSAQLSLSKMYALYKDECAAAVAEDPIEPVSEWVYRKVFNEEFNLSFGSPRTDTCKICDEFKVQVDAEKDPDNHQQLVLQWDVHKIRAESAYQSLREDTALAKSSNDIEMFTFDLQQALATPLLTTNVVFYKRQLWTYNLGVHDCKTDRGHMYMWHEGVASRGSEEMGSCLLHRLRHLSSSTATKLILYSDSCGGQNRNVNMVCLWLHIVASPEFNIMQIDHKFMVSGHSYLPNDRDFGSIETEKRKRSQIFSPQEWYQLCRKVNPFEVFEMDRDDFFAIKELKEHITNRKKTVNKSKVDWLSIRWIRVTQSKPLAFQFRCSLNELEAWKVVDVKKRARGRPVDMGRLTISPLYSGPRQIKKAKMDDLISLLSFVPPAYHDFYKDLEKAGRLSIDSDNEDNESVQSDEDRDSEDISDSDEEGG